MLPPLRQIVPFRIFLDRLTRSLDTLAWAWIAFGALALVSAAVGFLLLSVAFSDAALAEMAPGPGAPDDVRAFTDLFTSYFRYGRQSHYVLAPFGLLAVAAGFGLRKRFEWGRRLSMTLSGFVVMSIAAYFVLWCYMLYRMMSLGLSGTETGGVFVAVAVVFGIGMSLFGLAIVTAMSAPFVVSWRFLRRAEIRAALSPGPA